MMTPQRTQTLLRSSVNLVLVIFAAIGFMTVIGAPLARREQVSIALAVIFSNFVVDFYVSWRRLKARRSREARD